MTFTLYIDEDLMSDALLAALRVVGIDAVSTREAGRRGAKDDDQLAHAASQGRAIFTGNQGDFIRLHIRWLSAGLHHAGILILTVRSAPVGLVATKLRLLQITAADLEDTILFLNARPIEDPSR